MKKGLKVFLTASIVLSAVACSTANDKETKTKETKIKNSRNKGRYKCSKRVSQCAT